MSFNMHSNTYMKYASVCITHFLNVTDFCICFNFYFLVQYFLKIIFNIYAKVQNDSNTISSFHPNFHDSDSVLRKTPAEWIPVSMSWDGLSLPQVNFNDATPLIK